MDGMRAGRVAVRITGNRAVENAAIASVPEHEQLFGRQATDTRGTGGAGDLVSGEPFIEMKAYGTSSRGPRPVAGGAAERGGAAEPQLLALHRREHQAGRPAPVPAAGHRPRAVAEPAGARARERRYYGEVPSPVGVYDRLVRESAGETQAG